MKVTVNNEALAGTLGVAPGAQIDVKCKDGIPTNREWRNRFRDAKLDNCISLPVAEINPTEEAE